MARGNTLKALRTTRANLDAAAAATGLLGGEPYLITDEGRFAIGLTTSTYQAFATQDEIDAADFATGEMAMAAADTFNVAQLFGRYGNRLADSFDALTYVDVAGATNLDSATTGVLKPTSAQAQIAQATGTTIGDMTSQGGIAAAFNSVTAQVYTASARCVAGANHGFVGKDWGSGNTRTLTGFKVWSPSTTVGFESTGLNVAIRLKGSNSVPTGWDGIGFGGTTLFTAASVAAVVGSNTLYQTLTGLAAGAYRYHWIELVPVSGAGSEVYVAEAQFFDGGPNSLTVKSTGLSALAAPSMMKAIIQVKEIDAAVAGTDYTLECGRDGSTWATMTLTERYTKLNGLRVVEAARISVAGQPSGTTPNWRFKTPTGKSVELHDIYLGWE